MSNVQVIDNKAVCPECKGENLTHAFDVSHYGEIRIGDDGVPEAFGHSSKSKFSESSGERILCYDCGWIEIDCDLDVV